jgi:hypothetical protein
MTDTKNDPRSNGQAGPPETKMAARSSLRSYYVISSMHSEEHDAIKCSQEVEVFRDMFAIVQFRIENYYYSKL